MSETPAQAYARALCDAARIADGHRCQPKGVSGRFTDNTARLIAGEIRALAPETLGHTSEAIREAAAKRAIGEIGATVLHEKSHGWLGWASVTTEMSLRRLAERVHQAIMDLPLSPG